MARLFETVLVAVNPNDNLAPGILAVAADFAGLYQAKLHAAAVHIPQTAADLATHGLDAASYAAASTTMEETAEEIDRLNKALNALTADVAPDAEIKILDGTVSDALADYAEDIRTDILVIGSHQRGLWGSMMLGSSDKDIIPKVACSVFVVTESFLDRKTPH